MLLEAINVTTKIIARSERYLDYIYYDTAQTNFE